MKNKKIDMMILGTSAKFEKNEIGRFKYTCSLTVIIGGEFMTVEGLGMNKLDAQMSAVQIGICNQDIKIKAVAEENELLELGRKHFDKKGA
jgi:hypothetical protein